MDSYNAKRLATVSSSAKTDAAEDEARFSHFKVSTRAEHVFQRLHFYRRKRGPRIALFSLLLHDQVL